MNGYCKTVAITCANFIAPSILSFPEFTRYVRGLDSELATTLLVHYPTAATLAKASVKSLAGLRYDSRHRVGDRVPAAVRYQPLVPASAVVAAAALDADAICGQRVSAKVAIIATIAQTPVGDLQCRAAPPTLRCVSAFSPQPRPLRRGPRQATK